MHFRHYVFEQLHQIVCVRPAGLVLAVLMFPFNREAPPCSQPKRASHSFIWYVPPQVRSQLRSGRLQLRRLIKDRLTIYYVYLLLLDVYKRQPPSLLPCL